MGAEAGLACVGALLGLGAAVPAASPSPGRVVVGSKNFPESRLLAEIVAQVLEADTDLEVVRKPDLGGTLVCAAALETGEIDLYPEYTGTAWNVLLEREETLGSPLEAWIKVTEATRADGELEWLPPFGFDNTYALALPRARANELGLRRISDLGPIAGTLTAGFSAEFTERADGWPGLSKRYGIELGSVRAMEHGLAYQALARGSIDLTDAYATDGKLRRYDLAVLEDDLGFFPPYQAAPLARAEFLRLHPEARAALARLAWRIPEPTMIDLNYAIEVEGASFAQVARRFLAGAGLTQAGTGPAAPPRSRRPGAARLLELCAQHLLLTFVAVALAAATAIPLGIAIADHRAARRAGLGLAGALQTVPSLALLAFLIAVPGLGLSVRSAVLALYLYALLPILRNTVTGLGDVDPDLVEAARGIGLTERQVLLRVRLPLAARAILAGLRTATVITIGVATLAAFIGAGGLGEPIVTGLYLNDVGLILSGAIPAALLALLADHALGWLEAWVTPRGLRA